MLIHIRQATNQDFDPIWEIFHAVVSTGTYVYAPDTTKEQAYLLWLSPQQKTYVALLDGKIVASWFIKPNQPGLGSHVANGVYMVHPEYHGKGIGTQMVLHSLEEAKKLGYIAMQFNLVISTNEPAVNLYKKTGFNIIGTTPKGFNHALLGLVDTYIMHRFV